MRLRVAELGCGYGPTAVALVEMASSALGDASADVVLGDLYLFDKQSKLLEVARQRATRFECIVAQVADLSKPEALPAGIADLAVASFVLEHVGAAALPVALSNAARCLVSGGLFVAVDGDYRNLAAEGDAHLEEAATWVKEQITFDPKQLDREAALAGLKRVDGWHNTETYPGPLGITPKALLAFIGNFPDDHPAKIAWNKIEGGSLALTFVYRLYVKAAS